MLLVCVCENEGLEMVWREGKGLVILWETGSWCDYTFDDTVRGKEGLSVLGLC